MKDIRIDVGVCTMLNITLTEQHFEGAKEIIFTVKNLPALYNTEPIIERRFTEVGAHKIIIKPEESIKLTEKAVYDFNKVLIDGTRLKITDNGEVHLRKSVGDCLDEH